MMTMVMMKTAAALRLTCPFAGGSVSCQRRPSDANRSTPKVRHEYTQNISQLLGFSFSLQHKSQKQITTRSTQLFIHSFKQSPKWPRMNILASVSDPNVEMSYFTYFHYVNVYFFIKISYLNLNKTCWNELFHLPVFPFDLYWLYIKMDDIKATQFALWWLVAVF